MKNRSGIVKATAALVFLFFFGSLVLCLYMQVFFAIFYMMCYNAQLFGFFFVGAGFPYKML